MRDDATGGRVDPGDDSGGDGDGEHDRDENGADEKGKGTSSGTADVDDAAAYARLQEVDPASAARLHPNNARRVRFPVPLPRRCHGARSVFWTPGQWRDVHGDTCSPVWLHSRQPSFSQPVGEEGRCRSLSIRRGAPLSQRLP